VRKLRCAANRPRSQAMTAVVAAGWRGEVCRSPSKGPCTVCFRGSSDGQFKSSLNQKEAMWISILTKRCKLTRRMRHKMETYVRRALWRERRQISSIVLTISATTIGGEPAYRCRLRIWSHYLGVIVVSDVGHTVRTTTQHVVSRARHAVRRRLHKRLSKYRRLKRFRFEHRLTDPAFD